MIGLWAPNAERLSAALRKSGVDVEPMVGDTMLDAIRGSEAKLYIIAPGDEDEAKRALRAKEKDPSRVLLVSGLAGQTWSGEHSDLSSPLNLERLTEGTKAHFSLNGYSEPSPPQEAEAPLVHAPLQEVSPEEAPSEVVLPEPDVNEAAPEQSAVSPTIDEGPAVQVMDAPLGHVTEGRLLTVLAPKGGVGKTTMSLALAHHYAKHAPHKRVLYIDCNRQQADATTALFSGETPPDLLNLSNSTNMRADLLKTVVGYPGDLDNLFFLLGAKDREEADPRLLNPELFTAIANEAVRQFDMVICDTQVAELYDPFVKEFVIPKANFLLFVAENSVFSIENTAQMHSSFSRNPQLKARGVSIGVVFNRFRKEVGLSDPYEVARLALPGTDILGVIYDDPQWGLNMNNGTIGATNEMTEHVLGQVISRMTGEIAVETAAPSDTSSRSPLDRIKSFFQRPKKPKKKEQDQVVAVEELEEETLD